MGLGKGSAAHRLSGIEDIADWTDPEHRTEGRGALVLGPSATIRQILYIILNSHHFNVVEAEDWSKVELKALASDLRLVVIDSDPDLFPVGDLDWLDDYVPEGVPVIVLTDNGGSAPVGKTRPVLTLPKIFTWQSIASAVQMTALLSTRPARQ